METPTSVTIVNSGGHLLSKFLAAKFLELGYNVRLFGISDSIVRNHRFITVAGSKSKATFHCYTDKITLEIPSEKVFVFHLPDIDDMFISDVAYFIIGTWGTIRGDRYKYEVDELVVTQEVINDWKVL